MKKVCLVCSHVTVMLIWCTVYTRYTLRLRPIHTTYLHTAHHQMHRKIFIFTSVCVHGVWYWSELSVSVPYKFNFFMSVEVATRYNNSYKNFIHFHLVFFFCSKVLVSTLRFLVKSNRWENVFSGRKKGLMGSYILCCRRVNSHFYDGYPYNFNANFMEFSFLFISKRQ